MNHCAYFCSKDWSCLFLNVSTCEKSRCGPYVYVLDLEAHHQDHFVYAVYKLMT